MSDFLRLSYTITGGLARYGPQMEDAAAAIVAAHAEALRDAIVASFEEDKSGRLYTRADGTVYVASAPGEAPAVKEGDLLASIAIVTRSPLERAVISTDPKAPYLEYGVGTLEARPFFTPAADAARPAFLSDLANLEDRLRRG